MERRQIFLLLALLPTAQLYAQVMTQKKLQQLCVDLDNEFRSKIISEQSNNPIELLQSDYSFTSYLENAYYTNDKNNIFFYSKKVESGELLCIGVGSFQKKKAYDPRLKRSYILPQDIRETVYFFLNDTLICITQCIGYTDYNTAPSVFWVDVAIADFFYIDIKVIDKKYYEKPGMARMPNGSIRINEHVYTDEEKHIKEIWDNDERELKQNGLFLLKCYKEQTLPAK